MALVKITDWDKALAWMSKQAGAPVERKGDGPVQTIGLGSEVLRIGTRGDWTVVLMADGADAEAARPGFEQFLADDGKALAGEATFKDAFADTQSPLAFAWLGSAQTGALVTALGAPEEIASTVDFYASLFPAWGLWMGEGESGWRLLASEKGNILLRKLFVPQRKAPDIASYVGQKGWFAVRVSYNLAEVLDGVAEAIPPAASQAKAAVGMTRMMLPMAAGVTWDEIVAALSGHVAIAGDLSAVLNQKPGQAPEVLVMAGVNDPKQADALLEKAGARAADKVPGVTIEKIEIDGNPGRSVTLPGQTLVAVRADDVLLIGTKAVVEAALKRADGDHLGGAGAKSLDGDAMWAAFADLTPALAMARKEPQMAKLLDTPTFAPLKDKPEVSIEVELDRAGLSVIGDSAVAPDLAFAGLGAAWFGFGVATQSDATALPIAPDPMRIAPPTPQPPPNQP